MVKRTQHIGTFLHNEMRVSWGGISPMCRRSSIHFQKIFFLRSIAHHTLSCVEGLADVLSCIVTGQE